MNAEKEKKIVVNAYYALWESVDNMIADQTNDTASDEFLDAFQDMSSATFKTLFDTFSVNPPKTKKASDDSTSKHADVGETIASYVSVFDLIMSYAFVAVSTLSFRLPIRHTNDF